MHAESSTPMTGLGEGDGGMFGERRVDAAGQILAWLLGLSTPPVHVYADASVEIAEPVSVAAIVSDGDERIRALIVGRLLAAHLEPVHIGDMVAQVSAEKSLHVGRQYQRHSFTAFNALRRLPVLDSTSMVFASWPTTMKVVRCARCTASTCSPSR